MITLTDVSFSFHPKHPILEHLNLTVDHGQWVSLVGPNGCGKSTLLSLIAGINKADSGSIEAAGLSLDNVRGRGKKKEWARHVALMPQKPTLPEGMLVSEYIELGRYPHGDRNIDLVNDVMDDLRLSPFAHRTMTELSGGETQRVSLARALVQEPSVLLLDEPTSALDIGHAQEVLELIDGLREKRSLTILAAMHDLTLAATYGDKVATIKEGRIHKFGNASEVLTQDEVQTLYGANVEVLAAAGHPVIIPTRGPQGT